MADIRSKKRKQNSSVETPILSDDSKQVAVENIVKPFVLAHKDYRKVMDIMLENFNKGLSKDTHDTARVQMFPSYVRAVPDGTEQGDYLALDLGGTNIRVLYASLQGGKMKQQMENSEVPQHVRQGSCDGLFDYIAEKIYDFMKKYNLLGKKLPLGFTFSFPCHIKDINKAVLAGWTKDYNCEGVIGKEVVQLLHDAVGRRQDIDVECVAIINDTVGTLMSCAYEDPKCAIGLILGTGTNASYIERIENVEIWDGDNNEPRQVIIDTEWEYLGDDGSLDFIKTKQDKEADKMSIHKNTFTYEKMICGMFLGEIARLLMDELRREGHLFNGNGSEELSTPGRFYTKYVSQIETDTNESFEKTKQVFEELNISTVTEEDCQIAKYVCSVISQRAAYLASAGVACLLNKMNRQEVTVGIDGSLYRCHPNFQRLMQEKIQELVNPGIKFKLSLANDGSGKGAAIVAAVAHNNI